MFKFTRETTLKIHFILDQLIPPYLRDQKWFMWLPYKLLYKDKANIFLDFKDKAVHMTKDELQAVYEQLQSKAIVREIDISQICIEKIKNNIWGETVIDVGCGRGHLANILSENYKVSATDFWLSPQMIQQYPQIDFKQADIHNLPYEDNAFDTVVCTKTLEHVLDIYKAIEELRRITRRRLIIIVPKQRPYKYTFDLHLHFFPYPFSLQNYLRPMPNTISQEISIVAKDLYFQEDQHND
ncbi:MAG TPA: class I SAM-dependent methyltransferase [Anaerolineae bacterium]|nr:class I SAM-dependent methyltransferase [Anaerolineae bacterium]